MQITRLPTEQGDPEIAYQVQDTSTIQNVFYLVVNPEESTLSVTSLSPSGDSDEADTILVASRLGLDSYKPGNDSVTWNYSSPEDLADKLVHLIGQHSSIVMTDLGFGQAQDTSDPSWQSNMENPQDSSSIQPPDLVAVKDFEFTFDPTPMDIEDGEEDQEGLSPSDGLGGDEFSVGDEPLPDELDGDPDADAQDQ